MKSCIKRKMNAIDHLSVVPNTESLLWIQMLFLEKILNRNSQRRMGLVKNFKGLFFCLFVFCFFYFSWELLPWESADTYGNRPHLSSMQRREENPVLWFEESHPICYCMFSGTNVWSCTHYDGDSWKWARTWKNNLRDPECRNKR